jgi:hypothetical protein
MSLRKTIIIAVAWLAFITLLHATINLHIFSIESREYDRSKQIPDRISAGHPSAHLSGYRFINKSFASRNPQFSLVRILR